LTAKNGLKNTAQNVGHVPLNFHVWVHRRSYPV